MLILPVANGKQPTDLYYSFNNNDQYETANAMTKWSFIDLHNCLLKYIAKKNEN